MTEWTLAAVQAEPEILDARACIEKACELIEQASEADLIAFPEAFVPGYPQWTHDASFESDAHKALHARLAHNSPRVPEDLAPVQQAAAQAQATVTLPVTETEPDTPGTLYNTMAILGPEGDYLGKHRKLVPTHHERAVYGYGDGSTMRAFEVDGTRFGGLLCWENYMPLARAALYQQGIQLYLAPTADDLDTWQTTMQHIARESRCFVLAPALLQRKSAFPDDFELAHTQAWQQEPEINERGGTMILGPDGQILEGPVWEKEAILTARVDLDESLAERQTFDPAGHFSRPEVLELTVHGLEEDAE